MFWYNEGCSFTLLLLCMSDLSTTLPAQNTAVNGKLAVNLQSLLDDLFLVLTDKEATVIKRRFAL